MTSPPLSNDPAPLATAQARAIVSNANALGLTWELRMASVVKVTADSVTNAITSALILLDGDTESITAVPMVDILNVGGRVYVISVPPSGNFIVGYATPAEWTKNIFLNSALATVTMNVPATLKNFQINWIVRTDYGGFMAETMLMRVNDLSTASYFYQGTQVASGVSSTINGNAQTSFDCGVMTTAAATATVYGSGNIVCSGWYRPGYLFPSFETNSNAVAFGVNQWQRNVGGIALLTGPYTSLVFRSEHGANFIAGCSWQARGWY